METSALTFAEPGWFLALILIPVFAGLYYWSQQRSDRLIARIVAPRLKEQLAGAVSVGRRALRAVLILASLALIIVALARPQKGYAEREITQKGRDVIIAVDTSRSMLATDVTPTRLARAKLLAQDLMRLMPADRVGLVAFAGSAFLQAPLTLDQGAVLNSLDELDTNVIPKGGTNIAAAIREAEAAFGKGEGHTRALVILTDGEELDTDGITAARQAASKGIRIFTVGIGSSEGSLIPIRGERGGTDFVRDPNTGKPVQSRLDESRLKEIATVTGGFYVPLSPDAARTIFEKGVLPLEEATMASMTARQPIERYEWPLGAAIALLAVWMIVGDRRRRPAALRMVAWLAVAALGMAGTANAQTGVQAYEAGDYDKALENFSQQLQTQPDSEKLQYNAGTAAYKKGEYGKAVDYFTKAILSKDKTLREEASYNLGNALVRRGEGAKGNEEKKSDWKNAIQHYTTALEIDPKDKQAEENRAIVKKMLEDLEKQEQKKQDQKQDQKDQKDQKDQQQQNQQQNQKDQQNKDQSQQNKDQKDQQNDNQKKNDQKDDKGQQGQDQQKQQSQGGQQDQKDQQQKQDQQKQDQQKQDQQKQDQKNQQGQGGQQQKQDEKKDQQQNGNQQDQQKDQKPDQQPQSGQNQEQSPQKKGQQDQPAPAPTPGEKKQGELKGSQGEEKKDQPQGEGAQAGEAAEEEKDGQMSASQARSLLNSLRGDEDRVNLMQRQQTQDTLRDW